MAQEVTQLAVAIGACSERMLGKSRAIMRGVEVLLTRDCGGGNGAVLLQATTALSAQLAAYKVQPPCLFCSA